ncbi:hybrid sensor histidine kinase/response regulator [bacterium]|nr:hybrid sensor histidine kinase/response regulator [bacterium]
MDSNIDILVVEDSLTQAMQLKYMLEHHDYQVSIAKNGEEALASINKHKPAIVISDIMMPGMDGYELCRQIKTNDNLKDIPVILLTQLSGPEDIIKGLECGADNFVTKPYDEQFLCSRIQYIITNRKIRRDVATTMGMEIFFAGQKHFITSDRMQILDLLLSTYETVIQKKLELERANNELLAMKRELEQKNAELEELNEQKNLFLGMAAHDLRSPLSIIQSYSGFLLDIESGVLSKEQEIDFLSIIKSNSNFMLQLIDDLLDISKIESGKLELNLYQTDLLSLVKDNVALNSVLADKKQIKLSFSYDEVLPEMMIDAPKIEQVLNNLISNAVKFSYPHSTVEIYVARSEANTVISVKDEGRGIPSDALDKLFNPFEKISATGAEDEKGTGLGLVIARRIVDEHQGKIWVESEVGKGATFYVSLPIKVTQ